MRICCVTQETQTAPRNNLERGGREVQEGGDIGIPMADSC